MRLSGLPRPLRELPRVLGELPRRPLLLRRPAAATLAVVAFGLMLALVATVMGADRAEQGVAPAHPDHGPLETPAPTARPIDGDPRGREIGDERQWLRSTSTAPLRPRLASLDAAEAPEALEPHNPRIRIDQPAGDAAARVLDTPGIAVATSVHLAEVPVRHPEGRETLTVAFVDPDAFRVVTPAVTARAEPLWQALGDGQVAVDHDTARALGIRPGSDLGFGPFLRRTHAPVAGVISLGRAGIADIVAHAEMRTTLAGDAAQVLLAGVERLDELEDVLERLREADVGEVAPLPDIEPYHAELTGDEDTVAAFEPFTFHRAEGGRIRIDPAWVDAYIVTVDLPIIGQTRCHRLIIPQLRAALDELVARELDDLLDASDYGGCYVPRHIGWDPHRGLSLHAWGIAFDVNVSTNAWGADPELDPRVVEVFERYGFNWGGRWDPPDGMHFELGVLRDPADVPGVLAADD